MENIKTLGYDWEYGHEELALEVMKYARGDRLAILLHNKEGRSWELFGDLTVNLPQYSAEINEAYISEQGSKSNLEFIQKYKLGKILPDKGKSGFGTYAKVAFDLDRLAEYDRTGVEEYRRFHGIEVKKKVKEKKEIGQER